MLIITTIENRIIEIPHYLRQHTLDGCGGVGVSTRDCGSLSPGSIPGHGPIYSSNSCLSIEWPMRSTLVSRYERLDSPTPTTSGSRFTTSIP